jgi:gamma-glutamyltranspeptidase / glutathione hydrolase
MKKGSKFYHHMVAALVSVSIVASAILTASQAFALPYTTSEFAVASPSPYAAGAANEIAAAGGNVFDQAVAVALSMAVTHPYYASLGGGGFAVLRKQNANGPSTIEVIDFREVAPKATDRNTFVGKDPKTATDGGLASGVPGVPAGLFAVHKKYGKIAWKKLFAPALRLADKGFAVSGQWASQTKECFEAFNGAGKKAFGRMVLDKMKPPKERYEPLQAGNILKQPKLAKALRLLRDRGIDPFYKGVIAKDIIKTVGETGGVISADDMKSYSVQWRAPLRHSWRGYDLALMPPPSSGGLIIAQGLELLDRIEAKLGVPAPLSANEAHLWGEALKLSFAARGQMGDPMGSTSMTDLGNHLLEAPRLDRLAKLVQSERAIEVKSSKSPDLKEATSPGPAPATNEKIETTHFSLADREGNAVAWTTTLNGSYGSGMVSNDYGIAMNDEMDDFATQPGQPNQYGLIQGEANAVAPGKRPLSSMSPTIIEKDGQFFAALGAPGGPRIPSAVYQAIIRTIAQGANAEEAVVEPRIHHQFLPDTLVYDAKKFAPEVLAKLKSFGHDLKPAWIAKVYLVKRTADGLLEAAADPRGEAAAGGR